MKKIVLLILCCTLLGCQTKDNPQTNPQHSDNPQKPEIQQQPENLIYKPSNHLAGGYGNEDGYYHVKLREDEYGGSNIRYYDYATKQEIYLCNKAECKHHDETCTSFMYNGFFSSIFVYQDRLYIIETSKTTINALGEREQAGTTITSRNLDGSNPKTVYTSQSGYELEYDNFVIASKLLYIVIYQQQMIQTSTESSLSLDANKKLFTINLETGEAKEVYDFQDKRMIGVEGRKLVISEITYPEDPTPYLERKDFDTYDKIMMEGKQSYRMIDVDSWQASDLIYPGSYNSDYLNGHLYVTQDDAIYVWNLTSGEKKLLISFDPSYSYYVQYATDHYLIVNQHLRDDNYTFVATYSIDTNNPEMKKLPFTTRAPAESVMIIDQNSDSLLVKYDREGQTEKTWAGTYQYEETRQYIGLIKKTDFFEGLNNFQDIALLK